VRATTLSAAPLEGNNGKIRISRTGGSNAQKLYVFFSMSGTATNGADYFRMGGPLGGVITIPKNKAYVDVLVRTRRDRIQEQNETVFLNILAAPTYSTLPQSATGLVVIRNRP